MSFIAILLIGGAVVSAITYLIAEKKGWWTYNREKEEYPSLKDDNKNDYSS